MTTSRTTTPMPTYIIILLLPDLVAGWVGGETGAAGAAGVAGALVGRGAGAGGSVLAGGVGAGGVWVGVSVGFITIPL